MPIGSTLNGLKTLPRENIPPTTKIVRKAATEEDKEKVKDMWKEGLSASEISKETGFAIATVYNWCKGISSPNKQNNGQVDEETKEKAKSLYISGMAVARISEEIGVSKRSIFTWRNKYDWDKDKNKEDKEMAEQGKAEQKGEQTIDDTTLLDICHEGLIKIGDRIAECADGDDYILGYVHAILDVTEKFKSNKED